jgi:hypothetical protein
MTVCICAFIASCAALEPSIRPITYSPINSN